MRELAPTPLSSSSAAAAAAGPAQRQVGDEPDEQLQVKRNGKTRDRLIDSATNRQTGRTDILIHKQKLTVVGDITRSLLKTTVSWTTVKNI